MSVFKLSVHSVEDSLSNFNHSFFTIPTVLTSIFPKTQWWGYSKGLELICIWPVPLDENGKCLRNLPLTYYVGPIWKKTLPHLPEHRALSIAALVYTSFLETFEKEYSTLDFDLSIDLLDARPFLWWKSASSTLSIELKYTALLKVDALEVMSGKFRQVRRWELKNIDFALFNVEHNQFNVSEVISLYKSKEFVLEADSEDYPLLKTLERYLYLGSANICDSISIRNKVNGNLLGFALMGIHGTTMNIILSLTRSSDMGEKYLPSVLSKFIFEFALKSKCNVIDFNGANGQRLSDSKHSWGAIPQIYLKIRLKR